MTQYVFQPLRASVKNKFASARQMRRRFIGLKIVARKRIPPLSLPLHKMPSSEQSSRDAQGSERDILSDIAGVEFSEHGRNQSTTDSEPSGLTVSFPQKESTDKRQNSSENIKAKKSVGLRLCDYGGSVYCASCPFGSICKLSGLRQFNLPLFKAKNRVRRNGELCFAFLPLYLPGRLCSAAQANKQ